MADLARVIETSPSQTPQQEIGPAPQEALSRLAALHEEAGETARLANLLGNALHVILMLPALALAVLWLGGGTTPWTDGLWLGFVGTAALFLARFYRQAIRQPFARLQLKRFAARLSSCLLFAGFAWGAGAYLALPSYGGPLAAVLFATAPALAILLALREREAVFLFILPVSFLTAFAAVLRPFADGMLVSALVLLSSVLVCALAMARDPRKAGDGVKAAMLILP